MKKYIVAFLSVLLCFTLVACTNNQKQPDDKNETPSQSETNNIFKPESPSEKGQYVANYIKAMASIQWTPKTTFQMFGKYQSWGYNPTYEEGKTYYGPPFLVDSRGSMQEFLNSLEDGVYIGGTTGSTCIGSACYDAVYLALIQVCPSISFKSTEDMLPGNDTGLVAVGSWDTNLSKHDTPTITKSMGLDSMAECYAQLKQGDVVLKHVVEQNAGHARIVSSSPIIDYVNGKINPTTSYITTIEQTNQWDSTAEVNTTWWVEREYSFTDLYNTFFVPLTPIDYTENTNEVIIEAENLLGSEETAQAKKLKGEITSNHYITEVSVEIKNSNGTVIYDYSVFPNEKEVYLEDYKYSPKLANYENGTYHFTLKASSGPISKTLADYDFILK